MKIMSTGKSSDRTQHVMFVFSRPRLIGLPSPHTVGCHVSWVQQKSPDVRGSGLGLSFDASVLFEGSVGNVIFFASMYEESRKEI